MQRDADAVPLLKPNGCVCWPIQWPDMFRLTRLAATLQDVIVVVLAGSIILPVL